MPDKKDPETSASSKQADKLESLAEKLKLGKLDLNVEEVEERISPSETNVFDK
ncbi:MAG: hypothetical protein ACI8TQ_003456 [Planctomycetota bacterium]|jgi:hypothetical protein